MAKKNRFNFPQWLTSRRIAYLTGSRTGQVFLCCPFCVERGESQDTRFRLGVQYLENLGHCFNCGWSSRHALESLRLYWKLPKDVWGGNYAFEPSDDGEQEPVELPEDFQCLRRNGTGLERRAYRYILKRGITERQIQKHGIGVSFVGRYAYRVIFPVRYEGELRGLVARDFTGTQERKYLFNIGTKSLYNAKRNVRRAVLSEGVIKALRIARILPRGWRSMALLGHDLTEEQEEQLPNAEELVIWADPDITGSRGARRVAQRLLSEGKSVSLIQPEYAADEESLHKLRNRFERREAYNMLTRRRITRTADRVSRSQFAPHLEGGFTAERSL